MRGPIRHRRVFFIAGFDPRGPAPYHPMFVQHAARQAAIDGARIRVGERGPAGPDSLWTVEAEWDGSGVRTDWTFLRWDDLIRSLWTPDGAPVWKELWTSLAALARSGVLPYARRRAKAAFYAMMIPAGTAAAVAILVTAAALLTAALGALAVQRLGGPWPLGLAAGLAPLALGPLLWRFADRLFLISWMVRAMGFLFLFAGERDERLETRAKRMAETIVRALDEGEADEVLVVAHSYGTLMAMRVVDLVLQMRPAAGAPGSPLALLTLGQMIAMSAHLAPEGGRFREGCERIRDAGLFWLDVVSPSDGASSCRFHPLYVLGASEDRPVRRSPMFHASLAPAVFRHVRPRPYEYHFQYLRAVDTPGAYNFFRLTCGPEPLADFEKAWVRLAEAPE